MPCQNRGKGDYIFGTRGSVSSMKPRSLTSVKKKKSGVLFDINMWKWREKLKYKWKTALPE